MLTISGLCHCHDPSRNDLIGVQSNLKPNIISKPCRSEISMLKHSFIIQYTEYSRRLSSLLTRDFSDTIGHPHAKSGCLFTAGIHQQQLREASHIDFTHKKRQLDVWGWGGGRLAVVTFLFDTSWGNSIFLLKYFGHLRKNLFFLIIHFFISHLRQIILGLIYMSFFLSTYK